MARITRYPESLASSSMHSYDGSADSEITSLGAAKFSSHRLLREALDVQLYYLEMVNRSTQTDWKWVTMARRWRHARMIKPSFDPPPCKTSLKLNKKSGSNERTKSIAVVDNLPKCTSDSNQQLPCDGSVTECPDQGVESLLSAVALEQQLQEEQQQQQDQHQQHQHPQQQHQEQQQHHCDHQQQQQHQQHQQQSPQQKEKEQEVQQQELEEEQQREDRDQDKEKERPTEDGAVKTMASFSNETASSMTSADAKDSKRRGTYTSSNSDKKHARKRTKHAIDPLTTTSHVVTDEPIRSLSKENDKCVDTVDLDFDPYDPDLRYLPLPDKLNQYMALNSSKSPTVLSDVKLVTASDQMVNANDNAFAPSNDCSDDNSEVISRGTSSNYQPKKGQKSRVRQKGGM